MVSECYKKELELEKLDLLQHPEAKHPEGFNVWASFVIISNLFHNFFMILGRKFIGWVLNSLNYFQES